MEPKLLREFDSLSHQYGSTLESNSPDLVHAINFSRQKEILF